MVIRSRLFLKILLSYVILLSAVLVVVDLFMARRIHARYVTQEENLLESTARALSEALPEDLVQDGQSWAIRVGGQTAFRITVIDSRGKVLGDSERDPALMDDHSNRPEVKLALQNGLGKGIRYSRTLDKDLLYVACRVARQNQEPVLLRLAIPLQKVSEGFRSAQKDLVRISVLPFLLALIMGYFLTRSLTRRIENIEEFSRKVARGNLDARIHQVSTDELGSLAGSLNDTADQMQGYIKELTKERNRIRAILEGMQAGVLAADAQGHVTLLNKALATALDLDPAACLHRKVLEVIRDVDLIKILDQAQKQKMGVTATVEMTLGAPRIFEVVAVPLRGDAAQPGGVVAVLHDITKLQQLENVRKDFVANVSHELRTPLTAIRGFAETLLEGALEDKKNNRRFVEIIRSHAIRLSDLTSDLLTLSTFESLPSVPLRTERFELEPLLAEVVEHFKPMAQVKQQQIECSITGDLPDLSADREKLRQVFSNLLDNAIKFTGSLGQVSVSASLSAGGQNIEVHVKDNGPGIPSSDLPRIFERFYRVDKARSRELGGTGLGLAIVKHITEAHQGRVQVQSTLGQGSDFSVILPVKKN